MSRPRIPSLTADPFSKGVDAYVRNILAGTTLLSGSRARFRRVEDCELLKRLAARAVGAPYPISPRRSDDFEGEDLRRKLLVFVRDHARGTRAPPLPAPPVRGNLALMAKLFGLDSTDQGILTFLVALAHDAELKEVTNGLDELTLASAAQVVAAATHLAPSSVTGSLEFGSRLRSSGLVEVEDSTYYLESKLRLKDGLLDLALHPKLTRGRLLERFLTAAAPPTLGRDDFSHLAGPVALARELLEAALRKGHRGANILFYGPTGTGKTELARYLARELGVPLFALGVSNSEGASANTHERLSSLLMGNRLLAETKALLLFDEFEDLFEWSENSLLGGGATAKMSKQWFNAVLEGNPVPTIWITNEVEGIDPAFLRRFQYAIEFEELGARQRARVLGKHLGTRSLLSAADVEQVAQRFSASPAQFGTAVTACRLLSEDGRPDRPTLERVLAPVEKLVTGKDPSRQLLFDPTTYRIEALNCSEDLAAIAERLTTWKPGPNPGVSLCLFGPPGTGKSEFVKFLASRMGRRLVYRRASDIQSKWVGETERNIARAFREAEDDDAVLLFDEVDSFLRDRRGAVRSWEVSFVNEFLQQLECFRGVVACTTNLWHRLDEASVRRFVLKLEFRWLRPEQAMTVFKAVFGPLLSAPMSPAEESAVIAALARLPNLAPGDFAAVARRASALTERLSASELVDRLGAEVRAKGGPARSLGFGSDVRLN